ncbi:hypothetical protein ACFLYO_04690 [Chloroflexota bacterium]
MEPGKIIILLVIGLTVSFLGTYLIATQPQRPKWCNACQKVVMPVKPFSWMNFLFMTGLFYVAAFLMQSAKCPTCDGTEFSEPEDFGHFPPYEDF